MTICHVKRKTSFVAFSKAIVMDKNLSWKAKGILTYAFSRHDDWTFYKSEMMKHSSDGEHAFETGLRELEKFGYLHRLKVRNEKNQFSGLEWYFFEEPITEADFKKSFLHGGFSGAGKPCTGKPPPTNTEYNNKENTNTETTTSSFPVKEPPAPKPESVVLSDSVGSAVADVKNFDGLGFKVKNQHGEDVEVDVSEVYRYFSRPDIEKEKIEPWMIERALSELKSTNRQIISVNAYLLGTCKNLKLNSKYSTRKVKKNILSDSDYTKRHRTTPEEKERNRIFWENHIEEELKKSRS